jgi:hypothetical protein
MFQLVPQSGSGPSPQPTDARRAQGEELQGERTFVGGPVLLLDADDARRVRVLPSR